MSKAANTGFKGVGTQDGDYMEVPRIGGSSFTVASVLASTASAATIAAATGRSEDFVVMRVTATADCFITEAAAPTAVADGTQMFLRAGEPVVMAFTGSNKVAAIRLTADGAVYFTPLV